MKTRPNRGSHLPVLMKLAGITSGSILELGCGMYSTCYLHWACYPTKRKLVTCESKKEWMDFAKQFETDFHEVRFITDWDSTRFDEPWSIAFLDHSPDERRKEEIKKLTHADYVVVHDSENERDEKYKYSEILNLFKYHYKYRGARPHTSVFSNKYDLNGFSI